MQWKHPLSPIQRRPIWCHRQEKWQPLSSCMKGHCAHCLHSERPYYQWMLWWQLAEADTKGNHVNLAWKTDEGGPARPGQYSSIGVCCCNGCRVQLRLWAGFSPSIFSRFNTIWLFSVLHREKTLGWGAVLDWWCDHICCWEHFWGSDQMLLYHKPPSATTLMEKVYGLQWRLCWKIKPIRSSLTTASWSAYELLNSTSSLLMTSYVMMNLPV